MANYDQRVPLDYRFGQLTGGVDSLATTLASVAFVSLPSDLTAVRYVPIVLADDSTGTYEVVWVTGHAAGSQSITVVRAREGSTARPWVAGTIWRCAPTVRDAVQSMPRAQLPGDAHLGMRVTVTDAPNPVSGQPVVAVPWVKTAAGWIPAAGGVRKYGTNDIIAGTYTAAAVTLAQLTIPDPGWPYLIRAWAAAEWVTGAGVRYDLAVRDTTQSGGLLSVNGRGHDGDTGAQVVATASLNGPYTGGKTVLLVANKVSGVAGNGIIVTQFNGCLFAELIPAA